jgi:hypothetical protein
MEEKNGSYSLLEYCNESYPLTFFLIDLMTSLTPRLICFLLAAFFASLRTCVGGR